MNYKKWLDNNTQSLKNKRIIVNGATGGIGHELCMWLAHLGADITLLARDKCKANTLKYEILDLYPETHIDIIMADLLNIESINLAIDKIKTYNGIDAIILNAGVYNVPLHEVNTGYNNIFQTNFISPYYLVKQLLPELNKREGAKVVAVSSIAHNYSTINADDIDFSNHTKASKIYGNSKRFLTFALHELFKNETTTKLSIVHPGITLTDMTNHYPKAINWLVKITIKILFHSPNKASLNLIKGLFDHTKYHEWIGPKTYNIWGLPEKQQMNTCTTAESEQIYKIAEEIYEKIAK